MGAHDWAFARAVLGDVAVHEQIHSTFFFLLQSTAECLGVVMPENPSCIEFFILDGLLKKPRKLDYLHEEIMLSSTGDSGCQVLAS